MELILEFLCFGLFCVVGALLISIFIIGIMYCIFVSVYYDMYNITLKEAHNKAVKELKNWILNK